MLSDVNHSLEAPKQVIQELLRSYVQSNKAWTIDALTVSQDQEFPQLRSINVCDQQAELSINRPHFMFDLGMISANVAEMAQLVLIASQDHAGTNDAMLSWLER